MKEEVDEGVMNDWKLTKDRQKTIDKALEQNTNETAQLNEVFNIAMKKSAMLASFYVNISMMATSPAISDYYKTELQNSMNKLPLIKDQQTKANVKERIDNLKVNVGNMSKNKFLGKSI